MAWFSCTTMAYAANKCEVDGKITYSDAPCLSGKATTLQEPAAPQPGDVAQLNRQLAKDRAEGLRLQKERQKREAEEERAQRHAAHLATARQNKCASMALKKKWAEDDARRASGKSAEKVKLKAQRAGEKYALECGK